MMKFAEPLLAGLLLQLCVALKVKSVPLLDTCQENSNCSSDRAVCLNSTCVCVSGEYDQLSDTCDSMPLYPFGNETNDKEVNIADDICSPPIDVPYGIPVYKQTHTQLFVCTNGLVSFTQPYTTHTLPTNISGFGNYYLVAPFHVDINIVKGGNVFYRTYSGKANKTDIPSETVARIESFIGTRANLDFPLKTTFILVATWAKVAPYNEYFNYAKRSTFQLVLATDGFMTFALFIYGHKLMTWEPLQNPQLWIGYWAGEEFNWSHQDSFKSQALQMDKQARYKGIMGLLLHSLTTTESHCKKWYEDYKDKKDEITEAEKRLPQCPCNMDGLKPNPLASCTIPAERNDSDIVCVDLLYANASTNGYHGKSCCYNTTTRIMIHEPPNAGGFYQYHPKEYPTEHAHYDRYSRKYCCELSDLCRLYYELHPVGDCYHNATYTLASRGDHCLNESCCSTTGAVCLNYTCVCESGVHDTWSDACDSMSLYPFGVEHGDIEMRQGDDFCSEAVDVPRGLPMYDKLHTRVFVCANGMISFNRSLGTPSPPKNISHFGDTFLLAPFYVDIDNRDRGRVFYRTYEGTGKTDSNSSAIISDIERFIETQVALESQFTTTFILVATWADVVPFEDSFVKTKTATFQLVLATDGFQSYALYIYGNKRMTWALKGEDNPLVWIGFWAGEDFHWSHPYSFLLEALRIDKHAQHKGIRGLLIHSLTPRTVDNPAATCSKWYDENKHRKEEITEAVKRLPRCPCNTDSLRLDPMASYEMSDNPKDGDIVCVYLLHASQHGDHGMACCYNITTGLWIQTQPHAGGFNQYHPDESPKKHANYDLFSRKYCCKLSDLCHYYYDLHPVGECYKDAIYTLGASWGDPHLRTLDGTEYTFNGLGEYILLQLPTEAGGIFQLQARTERAVKADGNLSQATVFSAFAASDGVSSIQVEINFNKTGMVIQANGKDVTQKIYKGNWNNVNNDDFSGLTIVNLNGTIKTVFTNTGLSFNTSVAVKMLSITVIVPIKFRNKTEGLMGNFDGDRMNDFMASNGTVLPQSSNMSERDIFHFGHLWAVTNKSTLFNYTDGKGHRDYSNSSYVPKFLDEAPKEKIAEASKICEGNENIQCVFDYVFTDDTEVAKSSEKLQEKANTTANNIDQPVPFLTGCNVTAVTIGKRATCMIHFSDDVNIEFRFLQEISGVLFNKSTNTIEMSFGNIEPSTIRAVALNTKTNKASPEIVVPILMCSACRYHGVCTGRPRVGGAQAYTFSLQECDCDIGYDGDDCELDYDGCSARPCSLNRKCTDLSPEEERIKNVSYRCSECPQGYQTVGDKCIDEDECRQNNSPCQQNCINTEGGFKCTCRQGYRVKQDDVTKCKDINECEELIHDCKQICNNTVGGYNCTCFSGYMINSTTGFCEQVPTTSGFSSTNCSRAHGCRLNVDGEAECFCSIGYVFTKSNTCQDIDECKEGTHPCPHKCENTIGSFRCSCYAGYRQQTDNICTECKGLQWGKDCKEQCQCTGRGADKCHPVRGCECKKGWRGDTCDVDIDECEEQTNICPDVRQTCSNTPGSYKCACVAGYQADRFGGCRDIDECERYEHGCEDECVNMEGGYSCRCREGYKHLNKTHCHDIDECVGRSAGCEYKCENYPGHFSCFCPYGYVLREDRKSCLKVDNPCKRLSNLTCDHFCVIKNERAMCACKEGYVLSLNKASCDDIDECEKSTSNGCVNGTCVNLKGSYSCSCLLGTRLDNDGRTCIYCDDHHYGKNCESICKCVKGTCDRKHGCECLTGWTGEHCDQDVDECADGRATLRCPGNHTRCVNTLGSYLCQCEHGYISVNNTCLDIDECDSPTKNTCDQECKNVQGSYLCSCHVGFRAKVDKCIDINECSGIHGCDQLCDNSIGSYRCSCHEGFLLNLTDRQFCIQTSECSADEKANCSGLCVKGPELQCRCRKGFHEVEGSCEDIKECERNPSPCEHRCNEEAGGFSCSCDRGYKLDVDFISCTECDQWTYGENCSEVCSCNDTNTATCNKTNGHCQCLAGWTGDTCQDDVNECESEDDVCSEHSTCKNTDGSYFCRCLAGFQITGTGTCRECDNVHFGVDCQERCQCVIENTAACDNQNGSCLCLQGWNGLNCSENLDECADNVHDCPKHSECKDTEGSYHCTCNPGFMKINETCQDINECTEKICNEHNCVNTEGSYICLCKPGTVGIWDNCKECIDNTFGDNCSMDCNCITNNTIKPIQSCDRVTGHCLCNEFWSGGRCQADVNECLNETVCDIFPHSGCLNLNGTFACDCVRGYSKNDSTGECIKDEQKTPSTNEERKNIFLEIRLAVDLPPETDLRLSTNYKSIEAKVLDALYLFFNSTFPDVEIVIYDLRLGSLIIKASILYNETEENTQLIGRLLFTLTETGTLFYDNKNVTANLGGTFKDRCEVRTILIAPCPDHYSCVVKDDLSICRENITTDRVTLYAVLVVVVAVILLSLLIMAICIAMLRKWKEEKKLENLTSSMRDVTKKGLQPVSRANRHRLEYEHKMLRSRPRKDLWFDKYLHENQSRKEPIMHKSRRVNKPQPMGQPLAKQGLNRSYRYRWSYDGAEESTDSIKNLSIVYGNENPSVGLENNVIKDSNSMVWRRAMWTQQHSRETMSCIPRSTNQLDWKQF